MKIRMDELLSSIGMALDIVEGELLGITTNHGKRIACLCASMGNYLGMGAEEIFSICACALLHDNALTEYILSERPGKDQAINLRAHCEIGQRNVDALSFRMDIKDNILYHHERADGKGPFGKKEGEFSTAASLIAIADATDAAYHLQKYPEEKREELKEQIALQRGSAFTTEAAEAMLGILTKERLDSLKDDTIHQTYRSLMPCWEVDLKDRSIMGISSITARIIDYKSKFTRKHSVQIANIAWWMATYYGFDEDKRAQFYLSAALHDLGKLRTPTQILEKPGSLTKEEFLIIKEHAKGTHEMLKDVKGLEEVCYHSQSHHEKLDGSGYPFGLKAEELDFQARLLACIDVYRAVSEERPYHRKRGHKETMPILYGMVRHGFADGEIVRDLDRELALFDGGDLPTPPGAIEF